MTIEICRPARQNLDRDIVSFGAIGRRLVGENFFDSAGASKVFHQDTANSSRDRFGPLMEFCQKKFIRSGPYHHVPRLQVTGNFDGQDSNDASLRPGLGVPGLRRSPRQEVKVFLGRGRLQECTAVEDR